MTKRQYKLYNLYFDITLNDDDTFEYTKNNNKIDELAKKNGYFILISTLKNKDSKEIQSLYRRKDKVEKPFSNLKNYLDFIRLRTHNNGTIEKVLRELDKIKIIKINDGCNLMAPLTSKQKKDIK